MQCSGIELVTGENLPNGSASSTNATNLTTTAKTEPPSDEASDHNIDIEDDSSKQEAPLQNQQQAAQPQQPQRKRCDLAFSPKKCPKCRYQRCLEVGMGPSASKIGRPTKNRVAEVRKELHRIKPWLANRNGNEDMEERSASLLSLAAKDSRKRPAMYMEGANKKRHPSMPAVVYDSNFGGASSGKSDSFQQLATHIRHFSGDIFEARRRHHRTGGDEDDYDDEYEDYGDDSYDFAKDQLAMFAQRQLGSVGASSSSLVAKDATTTASQEQQQSIGLKPPPTAMLTVIQYYNMSGGNRQRFIASLREAGADREGSTLAWLLQSANHWFDIAHVMFQVPEGILQNPPPPAESVPSSVSTAAAVLGRSSETDPLEILSQFAVAQQQQQQQQQQHKPSPTGSNLPHHNVPATSFPLSLPSQKPPPSSATDSSPSTILNPSSLASSIAQQQQQQNLSINVKNLTTSTNNNNNTNSSPLLASSAFSPWSQSLRAETMARQVVQATKHLASLNLVSLMIFRFLFILNCLVMMFVFLLLESARYKTTKFKHFSS